MIRRIKYVILVFILLAGFSCKKDTPVTVEQSNPPPPPPPSVTVCNYLDNYSNSSLINGYMPQQKIVNSNCPYIISASGNAYAKPGGSNQIMVYYNNSAHEAAELYYGVKGVYGYYKADVQPSDPDTVYLVLVVAQAVAQNNFTIEMCMADTFGNISKPYDVPIELVAADPGKLQVTLTFDQPNDLDLHLIEPNNFEIGFNHPVDSCTGGFLTDDANANCVHDTSNKNIEEILFPDTVPLGQYDVRVVYYRQCIDSVNTIFSATALYNGQVISPIPGHQWQNPCLWELYSGASGTYVDCMRFEITATSKIVHFRFPGDKHFRHRPTRVKYRDK
jgi:hypothetical protein